MLALIAAGLTNREIADRIGVAPETVKKHASHIYGKLGVNSRRAAVRRAEDLEVL